MSNDNAREILTVFNEKVERFIALSFFKKARQSGAIIEFDKDKGWEYVFVGPDEESIESLILTLRLFMQNNERISLYNMRGLYGSLPISSGFANEFENKCKNFNEYLDSDTNLSIEENRQLTNRDILELFVYGQYAHLNAKRYRIMKMIMNTPFFPIFQTLLVQVIGYFASCLLELQNINKIVLDQL